LLDVLNGRRLFVLRNESNFVDIQLTFNFATAPLANWSTPAGMQMFAMSLIGSLSLTLNIPPNRFSIPAQPDFSTSPVTINIRIAPDNTTGGNINPAVLTGILQFSTGNVNTPTAAVL